mmetsp:Transcript_1211/g.2203  ORF Transcript_1211/g.2203 Transcript_1211/m.2203 type:complete len:664 (+) Transcript_1211:256-2247(+)
MIYRRRVLTTAALFIVANFHLRVVTQVSANIISQNNHKYNFHFGSTNRKLYDVSHVLLRGGGGDDDEIRPLSTERFQMDADANPEKINDLPLHNDVLAPSNIKNDHSNNNDETDSASKMTYPSTAENETEITVGTRTQASYSPQHQRMTRSDERAILGRAVLTTPHRRMPAVLISTGPRPLFVSPTNPGPIFTATPIFVTKFSLCESLGCALRDLRVIDQFSTNGRYSGPAFLARSNCVIVNVGHVRAIVMRNQLLIFLPEVSGVGVLQKSSGNSGTISSGGGGGGKYQDASVFGEGRGNASSVIQSSTSGMLDSTLHEANVDLKFPSTTMETIHLLVEALVTHLNYIYHAAPHHMFYDNMATHNGDDDRNGRIKNMATVASKESSEQPFRDHGIWGKKMGRKKLNPKQKIKHFRKQKVSSMESSTLPSAPIPPFELVVIESLLGHVCSYESTRVAKLINTAKDVLGGITYNFSEGGKKGDRKKDAFIQMQAKLGELLPLKNKVDELEAKCTEVAGAIAEVLKNDEDMAAMRLSEIDDDFVLDGDPNNLHVEVELLFEDYLLQMDEVLLSLRSVQSSVRNTEEVVEIELDLLRNRIMRYEMLLELSGLVVGVAAAVTGAFGMNLVNHFEDHATMFYKVCAVLVILMGSMGYGILRKLSNDNIL